MENEKDIGEFEEISFFELASMLLISAPIMYLVTHYILYRFAGIQMIEYLSIFLAVLGIILLLKGIIEKEKKEKN